MSPPGARLLHAFVLHGLSSPSSPKGLAPGTKEGCVMESHLLHEKLNLFVMSSEVEILNPATGAKTMLLLCWEGDFMA